MEKIGIIGIGKLGLCWALNLERSGYDVMGADVNPAYIQLLNEKKFNSPEPSVTEYLNESKNFRATTSIKEIADWGAVLIFIMVATPSLPNGSYDHSQIERVTDKLIEAGKSEVQKHLVIGCTTMPGYCNALAEKVKAYNYTVSYNPEFIAQGAIVHDQQFPDQVLIGEANKQAGDMIEALAKNIAISNPTICRMDPLSAEIAKLATNCFLTTKISFANSIGDMATKAGADADKILNAIGSDSRIGGKYLKYGYGFGGPCFPRDNRAMQVFAKGQGTELPISAATDAVNAAHLEFQFQQTMMDNAADNVLQFDGVAYKDGTVFIEESQKLALAVKLAKAGRKVQISDRREVIEQVEKLYPGLFNTSVKTAE